MFMRSGNAFAMCDDGRCESKIVLLLTDLRRRGPSPSARFGMTRKMRGARRKSLIA